MSCDKPLRAFFSIGNDGSKNIKFSKSTNNNSLKLPCGNCMGCRLERSRQWAVRCMHEASLYRENSFITLTFSPEGLADQAPTGSLDKRHMQLFMKRLRGKFHDRKIRFFYAGEYGDDLGRPHYHAALFNLDFPDKQYWKTANGFRYYTSLILERIWPYGFSVIGELTFESAAYIARACTRKITGDKAQEHYRRSLPKTGEIIQLMPEFCQASLKPGIGHGWYERHGLMNIYPEDKVISRGVACKPPRYYDKLLKRKNPDLFTQVKAKRDQYRLEADGDDTV